MLIKCPECNAQISDKASFCPHCGLPFGSTPQISLKKKRGKLPNGFGQITKLSNPGLRRPYRAMVTVGTAENGHPISKPIRPVAYFATYNEAYEALVEYKKDPYASDNNITLAELYDKWIVEHTQKNPSKSTLKSITIAWGYCTPLKNCLVRDIHSRQIKECIDNANRNGVPAVNSVKFKMKTVFNCLFDYAVAMEYTDRNYARAFNLSAAVIKDVSTTKKDHFPFTDDEMAKLWANISQIQYLDMLLVQCYTGWRPLELIQLRVENVDLEGGFMRGGTKTKAGTNRVVPIHHRIYQIVKKYYYEAASLHSEWLFNFPPNQYNDGYTHWTYYRYDTLFHQILQELNLNPNHRPHDCRAHFVTMAKKYNLDEYAIKYIVGHAISDITERVYTHRNQDWLKTEIEKIP